MCIKVWDVATAGVEDDDIAGPQDGSHDKENIARDPCGIGKRGANKIGHASASRNTDGKGDGEHDDAERLKDGVCGEMRRGDPSCGECDDFKGNDFYAQHSAP